MTPSVVTAPSPSTAAGAIPTTRFLLGTPVLEPAPGQPAWLCNCCRARNFDLDWECRLCLRPKNHGSTTSFMSIAGAAFAGTVAPGTTAGSAASARTRRAPAKEEPPSLGEDSDTPALQEREATLKQVLDKLQQLGVTSPLETLKAAGLAGGPLLAAQRLLR